MPQSTPTLYYLSRVLEQEPTYIRAASPLTILSPIPPKFSPSPKSEVKLSATQTRPICPTMVDGPPFKLPEQTSPEFGGPEDSIGGASLRQLSIPQRRTGRMRQSRRYTSLWNLVGEGSITDSFFLLDSG